MKTPEFDPNFKMALELTAATLTLFIYNPLLGIVVAIAAIYYCLNMNNHGDD